MRIAYARRMLVTTGLVVLSLTACTSGNPPTDNRQGRTIKLSDGVRLVAPDGALPKNAKVTSTIGHPVGDLSARLPSVASVEVTTTAQPTAPVMLTIPVPAASYAALPTSVDHLIPVLHEHEGAPVELLVGKLDRTASTVTVRTSSLSVFGVHMPSLDALRDQVGALLNGITGSVFLNAQDPSCAKEAAVRSAGYAFTSTSSKTVKWCLGQDGKGQPELQVVANRRYALLATAGKGLTLRSTTGGELPVALTQALTSALSSDRQATLSPGGVTRYGVTLSPGGTTSLRTEFDGLAQALVSLQLGLNLVLEIAGRLPFTKTKPVKEALAAIDAAKCVPQLLNLANDPDDIGRVGAMASACINPEDLITAGGRLVVGVVTSIVALLGSVISYLWTSGSALVDQIRGADKYTITVTRVASPADPCSRVAECEIVGRADLDGDGLLEQIALVGPQPDYTETYAPWGGFPAPTVRVIVQGKLLSHELPMEGSWFGRPYGGAADVTPDAGAEMIFGTLTGTGTYWYTMLTFRAGALVVVKRPGADDYQDGRWGIQDSNTGFGGYTCLANGRIRDASGSSSADDPGYDLVIQEFRYIGTGWAPVGAPHRTRAQRPYPDEHIGWHCPGFKASA